MSEIEKNISILSKYHDGALLKLHVDFLQNSQKYQIDGLPNEFICETESVRLALNDAITALQEKQEREKGWIPVSRRLPNKEECEKYDKRDPCYRKFVCTVKFNNGFDNFYQTRKLYFSEVFGWKYEAEDYNEFVIAWQPLPEPYKDGENDG